MLLGDQSHHLDDVYYLPHSEKATVSQHKPEINKMLFNLLVSGVSLRRASKILDIHYNTVAAKFDYLAVQAKLAHEEHLKTLQTGFLTFIHELLASPSCDSVTSRARFSITVSWPASSHGASA